MSGGGPLSMKHYTIYNLRPLGSTLLQERRDALGLVLGTERGIIETPLKLVIPAQIIRLTKFLLANRHRSKHTFLFSMFSKRKVLTSTNGLLGQPNRGRALP